ncbi:hypothetical protein ACFPVY_02835 [Flavobacterium qiangtangense]|uniref:Lipoprotein n=2 Tax=Flavobacterium qiangtangense TaxID=1442595 RepID=A0ABW1PJS2_9FLAO
MALLIFVSCKKTKTVDEKPRCEVIQELKIQAVTKGDESAYGTYLDFTSQDRNYYDVLTISLVMNQKYKTEKSFYQIFRAMLAIKNEGIYELKKIENLSQADRNYALHYLTEGAKLNIVNCQVALEKVYRNGYGAKIEFNKSDSIYKILENNKAIGDFYRSNRENKNNVDEIN